MNHGVPENANGFWLLPRVENLSPPNGLVLSWTQFVPEKSICDELEITLIDFSQGEAVAFTCVDETRQLGRTTLTQEELSQLIRWVQQLQSFEGEVYSASPSYPVSSYFSFFGLGDGNAAYTDIKAIDNFAARLFERIVGSTSIQ
jgi:hypothetical protein